MRKFKVIALSVGGNNRRIFHSGDTVNESDFYENTVDNLVKTGFLKEISEDEEEEKKKKGK